MVVQTFSDGINERNSRGRPGQKGPMKAVYNPQQDNWSLKYSYTSSPTVQNPNEKTNKNLVPDRTNPKPPVDSSSDYGTMSRTEEENQDAFSNMQDLVPR